MDTNASGTVINKIFVRLENHADEKLLKSILDIFKIVPGNIYLEIALENRLLEEELNFIAKEIEQIPGVASVKRGVAIEVKNLERPPGLSNLPN